jgi:hypothetical protein
MRRVEAPPPELFAVHQPVHHASTLDRHSGGILVRNPANPGVMAAIFLAGIARGSPAIGSTASFINSWHTAVTRGGVCSGGTIAYLRLTSIKGPLYIFMLVGNSVCVAKGKRSGTGFNSRST